MASVEEIGITQALADFVSGTGYRDLPEAAIETAQRCILDGLAVIHAGSMEPCAQIIRTHLAQMGGAPEAQTLGAGSIRAPAPLVALANGVAGHALDYDDTALSLEPDRSVLLHPTMPPLAAGLAVAEHMGASGAAFLEAFVLGVEVEVKIAEAIHPEHFAGGRGFHSSGTIGVFGAAVAAARLLCLDPTKTRNALALAATMAAGLGVNHGTMAKPLNMGRAAETGVNAARLAGLGFDGPANALEGGRGFFEAFGGGVDAGRICGRLGAPFAILEPGTSVKPYPSGVVGHPGMDAMKALVIEHDIMPEQIASVRVRTGPNVLAPGPLRVAHATTALEAKFCVPFQMAVMILRRQAGLTEFADGFVASPACQEMQHRISVEVDPEIAVLGKDKVVFDIEILTTGGERLHRRSKHPYRGGPNNPLPRIELEQKFRDCTKPTLSSQEQDRCIAALQSLDRSCSISGLLSSGQMGEPG